MTTLKNFINGKFVDSSSNETMSFENPAIGQVYGTAPLSRENDVDAAFKAASDAFLSWKRTAPADRSLALFRIADAMEALTLPEDKDKFLDLLYEQKRTLDALRKLGEEYMGEEEYKKFAN